jgi:DNA polymerase V
MKAVMICGPEGLKQLLIPMLQAKVPAGFPEERFETALLGEKALYNTIVKNPEDTYALEATGESMLAAKIDSGDILVVDRKIRRRADSIIIAEVDGEFTVKRFGILNGHLQLIPANPKYKPISIEEYQTCRSWGVVTHIIKSVYGKSPETKPLPPDI